MYTDCAFNYAYRTYVRFCHFLGRIIDQMFFDLSPGMGTYAFLIELISAKTPFVGKIDLLSAILYDI
jgi:hypothetical protein